ncbi:methyltransferase [Sulfurimonas sp. SAG-AH-194-I05]|nr:methyltransferase [Sulfurimonas sp. SAG-AH-194-I05]MDF1875693.1 methyltransferase [Sulfurimonas sp. SAG-AH-194-I05]
MLLYQPESGYCYNSDSLFLYDFISSFKPKGKVLDIGAGCGIVGLLVARDNTKVQLEAVEKQEQFVKYAKHNAKVNKMNYKLYESDFLACDFDFKYDYIISNPPFYPEGAKRSADTMLYQARYNINLPIEDFFKKVSQILKPHAHFIFCYDASQFALLCVQLEKVKLRVVDVQFVHSKLDKGASLVMVHARNSSKSLMKVWEPLVSYVGDTLTQRVQDIYDKAATQSIKCQM